MFIFPFLITIQVDIATGSGSISDSDFARFWLTHGCILQPGIWKPSKE